MVFAVRRGRVNLPRVAFSRAESESVSENILTRRVYEKNEVEVVTFQKKKSFNEIHIFIAKRTFDPKCIKSIIEAFIVSLILHWAVIE